MRYYIADCHFFHNSLNYQMDCRGFADAEEMNAYMIEQDTGKATMPPGSSGSAPIPNSMTTTVR